MAFGLGAMTTAAIGSQTANAQMQAAQTAQQQAVQQWLSINVPDPQQQQIELENYQVTGQLSPQMEQAFQQSNTGLENMQVNPEGRAAESQALAQMQQLGQNGGLDAQALQQTQQAINQTNANEQGQRGAIVQNAMARGQGQGGGAMLAAELEASQGDANQAAASGQSAAANAQQRALQAMQSSGAMGQSLNASDYAQAAAAQQAQDAINRFNTQNSQSVQNTNVGALNAAQAANLANAQSVSNANTGVGNQQIMYNAALPQQQFQNETQLASGIGGALTGEAAQYNKGAAASGAQAAGLGQGLASGVGAIGQYANNASKSNSGDSVTNPNSPDYIPAPSSSSSGSGMSGLDSTASDMYADGGEVEPPQSDFEKMLAISRYLKGMK